jgi:hypothetical protein
MLQSQANEPGLWVDPSWRIGQPATFAVVIGVSSYAHLPGGAAPIPDASSYDLKQLYVSALTAYRFFDWLRESYRYTAAPLARCWLLLSPTNAERAEEPKLTQHFRYADFDGCDRALNDWAKTMREHGGRGSRAAAMSRAIFFFSGHGLEQHEEAQILCPADFLKNSSPQRAISTANLKEALRTVPVRDQMLLFDACRNNAEKLQSLIGMKGWEILTVDQKYLYRDRNFIRATATGPGDQAWQPRSPKESGGLTIFGQALLEGLEARPLDPPARSLQPDCAEAPCCVRVAPLETFLRTRIPRLLKAAADRHGEAVASQPVRFLRECEEIAITEVPAPRDVTRGGTAGLAPAGPPPGPLEAEVFKERVELPGGWTAATATIDQAREIFGSDAMARVWNGQARNSKPRTYSLSEAKWRPDGDAYRVLRVERDEASTKYRIMVQLSTADAHWFELTDETGRVFAVVLPGDRVPPKFVLEIDFEPGEHARFVSVQAGLGENAGPLATASKMWERYRNVSALEAVNSVDMLTLERVLGTKVESPLAATIAALVLLRAGRLELLHGWLENLAKWFPERPDGAVLQAEQLRREEAADPNAAARIEPWTLQLLERGLPQLSETFAMAASQVDQLLRADGGGSRRDELARLDRQLDEAVRHFRSGGLFTAFSGEHIGVVTPGLIAGVLAPVNS